MRKIYSGSIGLMVLQYRYNKLNRAGLRAEIKHVPRLDLRCGDASSIFLAAPELELQSFLVSVPGIQIIILQEILTRRVIRCL